KCFSYGKSQNKGNTHGIKASLDALSAHMLNEHSSCSSTWCKSLSTRITGSAHTAGYRIEKRFPERDARQGS
ncbi:hypothetical protein MAR_004622, partial [Mya arenaria]